MDTRSPDSLDSEAAASEPAPDAVSEILQEEHEADHPEAGVMRAGEAGSVRDSNRERWHIEEGTDVICACGHKIGEVMDVQDDYLVVVGALHLVGKDSVIELLEKKGRVVKQH